MTPPFAGPAAREAFLAKVRARRQDGPYVVDHGGGFGGSTVVTGPTLRAGYILQSADDKRPEMLADDLNGAWAAGYEQALADAQARAEAGVERHVPTAAELVRWLEVRFHNLRLGLTIGTRVESVQDPSVQDTPAVYHVAAALEGTRAQAFREAKEDCRASHTVETQPRAPDRAAVASTLAMVASTLDGARKRLETISETHPTIWLAEDISRIAAAEGALSALADPPAGPVTEGR